MNNNYYVPPNGFNQFVNPLEKRNDKKILSTAGNLYGGAILFYFVMSVAVSFLIVFLGKAFPAVNMIFEDQLLSDSYSVIASVLYIGLPFFVSYLILKRKKYSGILPLGTTYNKKASTYLVMMMLTVILLTSMAVNLVSFTIQDILGVTFSSGFEDITVKGLPQTVMCILSMAVIPAIVEEIAVRGVILQPLRRYGDKFAIVASAVIFSLLHGNMVQIPYTLFAGIYFGYVAVAAGSLWPTIILHFFNNLFSAIITCVDGNIGSGAANVVTFLMLAAVVITGIVGGVCYANMRYRVKLQKGVNTLKTGEKISALFVNVPMIFALIITLFLTLTSISFTE